MNPEYPIYVISKSRWESRLTAKALLKLNVPFRVVIEPPQYEAYASVLDKDLLLSLPFSDLGQGSIPARNWVWEHALSQGAKRHWILDDNIRHFFRMNRNFKHRLSSGTGFKVIEEFADRYTNVALSGMQYESLAARKQKYNPYIANTRIYSCILIKNDLPFRWRGRYNEDTDLSLRVLKAGWCTILFFAFLCEKVATLTMKGGNMEELYQGDGRLKMAESLRDQHPDVVKVVRKWGRWQHSVNFGPFKKNQFILEPGVTIPKEANNYGLKLSRRRQVPHDEKRKNRKGIAARAQHRGLGPSGSAILDLPPRMKIRQLLTQLDGLVSKQEIISVSTIAEQLIVYLNTPTKQRKDTFFAGRAIEQRWYESLKAGAPDWTVYDGIYYIAELWANWVKYSRNYLLVIAKPNSDISGGVLMEDFGPIKGVLDLGCGIGYTTAALTELFPQANVCGTNLPDTLQMQVAQKQATRYGFSVYEKPGDIPDKIDLVFASEYFEHIPAPIAHLREVLALQPHILLIANSFGATAIGHFKEYKVSNALLSGTKISRLFNQELRNQGYEKIKTKLWNNRPVYWKKKAE